MKCTANKWISRLTLVYIVIAVDAFADASDDPLIATVIIDQFIEMIAGVNEFHPSSNYSANLDKKSNLLNLLDKYSKVFSLIVNTRRSKNIKFHFDFVII